MTKGSDPFVTSQKAKDFLKEWDASEYLETEEDIAAYLNWFKQVTVGETPLRSVLLSDTSRVRLPIGNAILKVNVSKLAARSAMIRGIIIATHAETPTEVVSWQKLRRTNAQTATADWASTATTAG